MRTCGRFRLANAPIGVRFCGYRASQTAKIREIFSAVIFTGAPGSILIIRDRALAHLGIMISADET